MKQKPIEYIFNIGLCYRKSAFAFSPKEIQLKSFLYVLFFHRKIYLLYLLHSHLHQSEQEYLQSLSFLSGSHSELLHEVEFESPRR